MRLPSVKTLARVFFSQAKEARTILEMTREELVSNPAASEYIKRFHRMATTDDIRMHILDTLGRTHGVESVKVDQRYADYLNTGDSYRATLIYWDGKYRVQSYGDFIEKMERCIPKRRRG